MLALPCRDRHPHARPGREGAGGRSARLAHKIGKQRARIRGTRCCSGSVLWLVALLIHPTIGCWCCRRHPSPVTRHATIRTLGGGLSGQLPFVVKRTLRAKQGCLLCGVRGGSRLAWRTA
eukprot:scaffold385_cov305-Pinguiococcus_pyrenoidosus.AAC.2